MRLRLLFFGMLKDALGVEQEAIEAPDGATVGSVLRLLEDRASNGKEVWGSVAVAVNREYAGGDTVLYEGDEVAFLPPVSGGREEERA